MLHTLLQFRGLARSRVKHKPWQGCSGGCTTSASPPDRAQTPARGYDVLTEGLQSRILCLSLPGSSQLSSEKPAALHCWAWKLKTSPSWQQQWFTTAQKLCRATSSKAPIVTRQKIGAINFPQSGLKFWNFPRVQKKHKSVWASLFDLLKRRWSKNLRGKKPHSLPFCLALQHE